MWHARAGAGAQGARAGAGHESHPQGGLVLGTHPTAQKHATGAGGRRHAHVDMARLALLSWPMPPRDASPATAR
jgi:hypothetical protein